MTVPAQCSNCWYGQTTTPAGAGLTPSRLCRLNGPSPASAVTGQPAATWPAVLDTDWCGDGIANSTGVTFAAPGTATPPGTSSF